MGLFDNFKKMAGEKFNSVSNSIQQTEIVKPLIIKQAASVNYDSVLSSLSLMQSRYPQTSLVIESVETIKEASFVYNNSESPSKDEVFINTIVKSIDAERVMSAIEPIIEIIPAGKIITMVLRLIIKYKKPINHGEDNKLV